MQEQILDYIPTRLLSIKITLTNGKLFPDGNNFIVINCDGTAIGYENNPVLGGGFTCSFTANKNNDLLNNSATITFFGVPEEYQITLDKLQQFTGIALYENYIQVYAGYEENGYELSDLIYQGQIETAQPDKNNGLDSFKIISKGIYNGIFATNVQPISVHGNELLRSLFDRIINQSLSPVDMVNFQKVYKLTNQNVLCASNETFSQSSMQEQLTQACLHNNCYPPRFENNKVTIMSKDYNVLLSDSNEPIIELNENDIIGYPAIGSGLAQRNVTLRYSEKVNLPLLTKIKIVGDYDTIDTQQEWYINSIDYALENRGEKWQITFGLGTFPYNVLTNRGVSDSTQTQQTQQVLSLTPYKTSNTKNNGQTVLNNNNITNTHDKVAPIGEMQNAGINLPNLFNFWFNNFKKIINTGFPAQIVGVNTDKKRYTVQSLLKILNYNGTAQEPIVIQNVPVFSDKYSQIEYVKGDIVRIQCDQYYTADIYGNNYTVQIQKYPRRLSASDCVITGYAQELNNEKNCVTYNTKSMKVRFEENVNIGIDDNTNVNITPSKITIQRNSSKIDVSDADITVKCGAGKIVVKQDGSIELGEGILSAILTEGLLKVISGTLNIAGVQPYSGSTPPPPVPCVLSQGSLPSEILVSGGSSLVKATK